MVRMLMGAVRAYRLVSRFTPPRCRFHPTCSTYALQALEIHGLAAVPLIFRRLARCHPFHPGGLDPVPAPRSSRCTRSST